MTSATFEKEFESLNDTQQKAVGYFIRFLLSQNGNLADDAECRVEPNPFQVDAEPAFAGKPIDRKLGGFEKGYYMAPDFNAPLPDFAEYTRRASYSSCVNDSGGSSHSANSFETCSKYSSSDIGDDF